MTRPVLILLTISLMIGYLQSYADQFKFVRAYQWNNIRSTVARDTLLYCAMDEGLQILNFSDSRQPAVIGQCAYNDRPTGYGPSSLIAVYDNYAFLARRGGYATVFDIYEPSRPEVISYIDCKIWEMAVKNDFAYIAESSDQFSEFKFKIIAIDDIKNPLTVSETSTSGFIDDILIDDHYAFLAVNKAPFGVDYAVNDCGYLKIYDLTDRSAPIEISNYMFDEPVGAVAVKNGYAYLLIGRSGLQIMDISSPAEPIPVAAGACQSGGLSAEIAINGDYAYLSPRIGNNCVFDISDPLNPLLINDDSTGLNWTGFSIGNDLLFASTTEPYMREFNSTIPYVTIFDIADPADIREASRIDGPHNFEDVAVDGDLAYLYDMNSGCKVLNINAVSGNELLAEPTTEKQDRGTIALIDSFLYISNWGNLKLVNISEPLKPVVSSVFEDGHNISIIDRYKNHLFAGHDFCDYCDFGILDISDPSKPVIAKKMLTGSDIYGKTDAANDLLYIAAHKAGIKIFDIKDAENPVFLGSYDTGSAEDIKVRGKHAFVADYEKCLIVLDISRPEAIEFVSSAKPDKYQDTFYAYRSLELDIRGNIAFFLVPLSNKIYAFDISDPENPSYITSYGNFNEAVHFRLTDKYILIPSKESLMILEFEK